MERTAEGDLPARLTLEEAFRAAFFMVESYVEREQNPDGGLILLEQYLQSDPARWSDWLGAVKRGLEHPTVAVEYLYDWRTQSGKPAADEVP